MNNTLRIALLNAILMMGATAAYPQVAAAQQSETQSYSIAAGDLDSALQQWASQSGQQLMYAGELVAGKRSAGLSGAYAPAEALRRLLQGSGLESEWLNARTLVLKQSTPARVKPAENAEPSASQRSKAGEGEAAVTELEKMVVTGTRIRGFEDLPVSGTKITRDDIEQSGAGTVEDVLENLPQNFAGLSSEGSIGVGGSELQGLNSELVTAVDLHGLGAQSTLVLVNGQRTVAGGIGGRVVDVSTIPLSAVDSIEVTTGGRSAIYGSDAVAGVVNFSIRRQMDGAETQIYSGARDGGGAERYQLSQSFGKAFANGGFILAADYAEERPLDAVSADLVAPANQVNTRLEILPKKQKESMYAAGEYYLNDRIQIYGDARFTNNQNETSHAYTIVGCCDVTGSFSNETEQSHITSGAELLIGEEWKIDVNGVMSRSRTDSPALFEVNGGGAPTRQQQKSKFSSISTIAEGPLFDITGVTPRAAIGTELRREDIHIALNETLLLSSGSRDIKSLFGEVYIPFAPERSHWKFDVSLAGRYDRYSDFGGTFNPQVGFVWKPTTGISIRTAYSTSFRAPDLYTLNSASFLRLRNLQNSDPPGGNVPILLRTGGNKDLGPETAETWSAGVNFKPQVAPWANFDLSYFQIDYKNRIESPLLGTDLLLVFSGNREARYPGLVDRAPTPSELTNILEESGGVIAGGNATGVPFDPATQDLLAVFPNLALVDNRRSNIALENVNGLNLNSDVRFESDSDKFGLGISATYTRSHERRITRTSPHASLLNEVGKPVDLRGRLRAWWSRGSWSAFFFVNYTKGYDNSFVTPTSTIDSWITADGTIQFDGRLNSEGGHGFVAALSVQNIFNSNPPEFLNNPTGLKFDPANASPMGRFVSVRFTKRW